VASVGTGGGGKLRQQWETVCVGGGHGSNSRWSGRDFEADWYYSDGPGPIYTAELIFQYSNRLQSLKFKLKTFLMSKNI
jgi:hypothetical protein